MPKQTKTIGSHKNASLLIIPNSDVRIPGYAKMYEELKGICIGGCISTGYGKDENNDDWTSNRISDKQSFAHAHSYLADEWFGWICSPHKRLLTNKWCLLHEIAHLIAYDQGHTEKWKQTVVSIGGSIKQKQINWKYKLRDYTKLKEETNI